MKQHSFLAMNFNVLPASRQKITLFEQRLISSADETSAARWMDLFGQPCLIPLPRRLPAITGIMLALTLLTSPFNLTAQDTNQPSEEMGWPAPSEGFPPPMMGGQGFGGPPPFGPGGFGPGGPGGMSQETKLVKQFDKDGDKRLNRDERQAAREHLKETRSNRGFGGPGGFGPGGRNSSSEPAQPGRKLTPSEVQSFPDAPVYDETVLRTFFLEFEEADWEQEMADFNNTDVEVPATLTVDGKTYNDVGVHFRGQTSFMMVSEGYKRPLNLSLDWVHEDQNLGGYRTFNLLNAHEDPTFLRTVLYTHIAREYIPAPKANFVRVVINGECWGVYVSAQQFNKDFANDFFGTTKGARWKVPGSPGGRGGLEYLGDNIDAYKQIYEIKSKDKDKSWEALIELCRVLNETSSDQLEEALDPILDIDGALKFLALEVALINNDGYWIRASDYSIYQDEDGRFHIIPHDANETMSGAGGPGFGGGPRGGFPGFGPPGGFGMAPTGQQPTNAFAGGPQGPDTAPAAGMRGPRGGRGFGGPSGGGVQLDPLVGLDDTSKPLRSKLLAVPALRERYLGYVQDIAENWLDWNNLGPLAKQYQSLIAEDVKLDTRKLDSTEAFFSGIDGEVNADEGFRGPGGPRMSLRSFAQQRRDYLLHYQAPSGR